ncbi:28S ribosomal protein S36, mitochondrial [Alligator sinensis]|uniref:28S ribosomal protein S36, mitochondrial n=1 Tax=Alligator sinensis TaxID=38654 RepID=A0A1U7RWG3_ALLSI|nr:28S ribosomal protein S36, mitochondrial [Alligator sinensis]
MISGVEGPPYERLKRLGLLGSAKRRLRGYAVRIYKILNTKEKVVKPHTPLIKFPDRQSTPKLKIQESLQARVPPLHGSAIPLSVGSKQPVLENISPISRVQGVPDTSELVRTLPQKYRRKTMSDEEMEFIQRGGPE